MTDARVEAAFEAAWNEPCLLGDPIACHNLDDVCVYETHQENIEAIKGVIRKMIVAALTAADAAAWNTDIKKAPGFRQTIVVHLKNGDTTLANNEFPQGEDGWVDMMGDNIAEADIEAWMLIPRFTTTSKEATQ